MSQIEINEKTYQSDLSKPLDISIPMHFNGPQPNAFGVDPATSVPCRYGSLIGDTRNGGSCNFERYTLIPHCNGTHTECVGHITHERISVGDCLKDVFSLGCVVTVEPESDSDETYSMAIAPTDRVITRRQLERYDQSPSADALIIRTKPNDESKLSRQYVDEIPPYLTTEAMRFIVERDLRHLIVDLPSIDRLHDEGRLSNHRIFWNVDAGSFDVSGSTRLTSTITELSYIPDHIDDGLYLLNLQIAPFASDASPSRPLLFRIEN